MGVGIEVDCAGSALCSVVCDECHAPLSSVAAQPALGKLELLRARERASGWGITACCAAL